MLHKNIKNAESFFLTLVSQTVEYEHETYLHRFQGNPHAHFFMYLLIHPPIALYFTSSVNVSLERLYE